MDRKRDQRVEVPDPAGRFSDRVENYQKYRPGYPDELFDFLRSEISLDPSWTIADIGSGTGISAKPFLENGNTVYAVEVNNAMRNASVRLLGRYERFKAFAGRAEDTGLSAKSVDLAFAGQSFHWFCNPQAVEETRRILKPGGYFVVVWNERELGSNAFQKDYESLVLDFATDYHEIRHDRFSKADIDAAFGRIFLEAVFGNSQELDREGLAGRILSSSYMPEKGSPSYPSMVKNLDLLFDKHQENDRISVSYKTKLYYSKF